MLFFFVVFLYLFYAINLLNQALFKELYTHGSYAQVLL